jgi:hypothetical protein
MHIWILISRTQLLNLVEINDCMATEINIHIQLHHMQYWQNQDKVRGDEDAILDSQEQRNSVKLSVLEDEAGSWPCLQLCNTANMKVVKPA